MGSPPPLDPSPEGQDRCASCEPGQVLVAGAGVLEQQLCEGVTLQGEMLKLEPRSPTKLWARFYTQGPFSGKSDRHFIQRAGRPALRGTDLGLSRSRMTPSN